jgi:hypothetical protein
VFLTKAGLTRCDRGARIGAERVAVVVIPYNTTIKNVLL